MGVDAHARARRAAGSVWMTPDSGAKPRSRVFRGDAALDGVAPDLDVLLAEAERLARARSEAAP